MSNQAFIDHQQQKSAECMTTCIKIINIRMTHTHTQNVMHHFLHLHPLSLEEHVRYETSMIFVWKNHVLSLLCLRSSSMLSVACLLLWIRPLDAGHCTQGHCKAKPPTLLQLRAKEVRKTDPYQTIHDTMVAWVYLPTFTTKNQLQIFLDLPKGAKWFVKGVNKPSLRV